jgi:hypothetical protein
MRQPEAGQRHAGKTDAELLQRRAARDRLGQPLGEFIELVVHVFPFPYRFSASGNELWSESSRCARVSA